MPLYGKSHVDHEAHYSQEVAQMLQLELAELLSALPSLEFIASFLVNLTLNNEDH